MKAYFLFILILISSYSYADEYKHIIKLDNFNIYLQEGKKSSFLFEKQLIQDLQNISIIKNKIKKISITINLHNKPTISYSNLNPQKCEIGINYNINQWNIKGDIFSNFYDELLFNILHEIGHCYLSREALLSDINWIIPIKSNHKLIISNMIEKSFSVNQTPLQIIYHEIYADTFASYFLQNTLNKDISPLVNFRTAVFYNHKNSLYPTHFSLKYLNINKNNLQTIENILEYSQLGFFDYLQNINKDIK